MSNDEVEKSIASLKGVLQTIGTAARSDNTILNCSIYSALTRVIQCIDALPTSSSIDKSLNLSTASLQTLEDLCSGKSGVPFIKSFSSLLCSVYGGFSRKCPGFVVRTILTAMISITSSKFTPQNFYNKECAVLVIGILMKERFSDCGSLVTDCVAAITKLCKSSIDIKLRETIFNCLVEIIQGGGSKTQDLYAEIVRLASKYVTDKSPDVRGAAATVLKSMVGGVPAEQLLALTARGLEEENGCVQSAYAETVAAIFTDQINSYMQSQEQAKVGIARGTAADTDTSGKGTLNKAKSLGSSRLSITKLRDFSIQQKKVLETYEFKSVVGHLLKQVVKSAGALRAGYIAALGYLVRDCIQALSDDEIEWLVLNIVGVFHDSSVMALSYEDTAFLRARISHLLRAYILVNLSEPKLRVLSMILTKFVSSLDDNTRVEAEVQIALNELEVVVNTLRCAAIAVVDEIIAAASMYLRHSSYGVRSAAASLLSSLFSAGSVVAAELLRNALSHSKAQSKQLLVFDGSESNQVLDINALEEGLSPSSPPSTDAIGQLSSKKKNVKDTERLQRMFFFHGNTLVISKIMRYSDSIQTGLPSNLILELFDFGLELLQQDVLSTPPPLRHVSCSIVRAGSLIVSSCVSMGYKIARCRLQLVLQSCYKIFKSTDVALTAAVQLSNEDMIYEIMIVEAGLVCISTLLSTCPEYLTLDDKTLPIIVDGLEICFRSLKGKYQPGFRTHFRFRTLHVILMECFSSLPHGFFPNSCQTIFVEALRVFRDSIAAGYECTGLSDMVCQDYASLLKSNMAMMSSFSGGNLTPGSSSSWSSSSNQPTLNFTSAVLPTHLIMLKLETYATALQKKESEAFLTTFSTNNILKFSLDNHFAVTQNIVPDTTSVFSCAQIDARTIDASIILLASTFPLQSSEYQDKAIQLCQQAVSQFSKTPSTKSISLFSSEDEKKKKDRKMFLTIKNVLSLLNVIVKLYPVRTLTQTAGAITTVIDPTSTWFQSISEILFEMLGSPSFNIKSTSAVSLGVLVQKANTPSIIQTLCIRIRSLVMQNVVKKGESMNDFTGFVVMLSSLWTCSGADAQETRSVILTTLFDCLRKLDSSAYFKSHCILSVSVIVREVLSNVHISSFVAVDLVEKVTTVVVTCAANILGSDDIDLLNLCLMRLLNATIPLAVRVDPSREKTDALMSTWRQILEVSYNSRPVLNESLDLLSALVSEDIVDAHLLFVLNHFTFVIENRRMYTFDSLWKFISSLSESVTTYSVLPFHKRIDGGLFELLDYCLSFAGRNASVIGSETPFAGLEIKRCSAVEECQTDKLNSLIEALVNLIYKIVVADVRLFPDTTIVYWLVLARSIVLNTSLASIKDQIAADSSNAGEDKDEGDVVASTAGRELASPRSRSAVAKLAFRLSEELSSLGTASDAMSNLYNGSNYQTFASFCREQIVGLLPDISSARVELKCIAMRCAAIAMKGLSGSTANIGAHINLLDARNATSACLTQLGKSIPSSKLLEVPRFVALFLNDVVSLACTGATYTVDDKPINRLQKESIGFILDIVALFRHSIDPDIQIELGISSNSCENKILSQFLSQLLGALRVGLASTNAADVYLNSGSIVCELIEQGFISDQVILRRLLKTLLSFCDESNLSQQFNNSSSLQLKRLLKLSAFVSENVSTSCHLAGATIAAKLVLLSTPELSGFGSAMKENARQTVSNGLQESINLLSSIWMTIAIDFARLAALFPSLNADLASTSSASMSFDDSENNMDEVNHPLRGGITYSPFADIPTLSHRFNDSLPFVLCAFLSSATNVQCDFLPSLFSLSIIAIQRLLLLEETNSSIASDRAAFYVLSDNYVMVGMIIRSFILLLKNNQCLVKDAIFITTVSLSEWNNLLSYIIGRVISRSKLSAGSAYVTHSLLQLCSTILSAIERFGIVNPEANAFVHSVWTDGLHLAQLFLSDIYQEEAHLPTLKSAAELSCSLAELPFMYIIPVLINAMSTAAALKSDFISPTLKLFSIVNLRLSIAKTVYAEVRQSSMDLIASQSKRLCTKLIPVQAQNISFVVMEDFVKLSRAYAENGLATSANESVTAVMHSGLRLWKSVVESAATMRLLRSNNYKTAFSAPLGVQLSRLIMDGSDVFISVATTAVHALAKVIHESATSEVGLLIASTFLTPFMFRLTAPLTNAVASDLELKSAIVRCVFLIFSLISEPGGRDALLGLLLPPLSDSLLASSQIPGNGAASSYFLFCGKGLTQIARLCPDSFKTNVVNLDESRRALLQSAMMASMQATGAMGDASNAQAVQQSNGGIASKSVPVMKIDIGKYKK